MIPNPSDLLTGTDVVTLGSGPVVAIFTPAETRRWGRDVTAFLQQTEHSPRAMES